MDALDDIGTDGLPQGPGVEAVERIDAHLNEAQRRLATLRLLLPQLARVAQSARARRDEPGVTQKAAG